MRIVYRNLKHGKIKVVTETLDDLWHLQHLLEPGDLATALTCRREKSETDKVRPERVEKKLVKLSIRVESVKFHRFSNKLRVLGTIEEGPDKGKHHTLGLESGSKLTITKTWKHRHLQRLKEATKASRRPRILLVALDDESAALGLVRQYGLEDLGGIYHPTPGKRYEVERKSDKLKFFHQLASFLKDYLIRQKIPTAIVAGPGFTKKEFHALLRDRYPEIVGKVRQGDVSSGGKSGLNEIVRRGLVQRVSREDRISLETMLVEKLLAEVAKDGPATYGLAEVKRATDLGAVEALLVTDRQLRREREELDSLLEGVRKTKGKITIVSTEHEAGQRLAGIGGIGALLRFKTH
jgi:protein pelota